MMVTRPVRRVHDYFQPLRRPGSLDWIVEKKDTVGASQEAKARILVLVGVDRYGRLHSMYEIDNRVDRRHEGRDTKKLELVVSYLIHQQPQRL